MNTSKNPFQVATESCICAKACIMAYAQIFCLHFWVIRIIVTKHKYKEYQTEHKAWD